MATLTTHLGLTKPATTDFYDITVANTNMDLLDTAVNGKAASVHVHTSSKKIICSSASSATHSGSGSTSTIATLTVLHDTDETNSGSVEALTLPSDATKIQVRLLTRLGRSGSFSNPQAYVTAWGETSDNLVGTFNTDGYIHDKEIATVLEKPSDATDFTLSITLAAVTSSGSSASEIDLYYVEIEVLE